MLEEIETVVGALPWQVLALFCGGVSLVCWWIGYLTRRRGAVWGGYLFCGGLSAGVLLLQGVSPVRVAALGAFFACGAAVAQAGLSLALAMKSARVRRRLRGKEQVRETRLGLPPKGNGYLRERLETVLCNRDEGEAKRVQVETGYVDRVAARLKGLRLSTVDELRLDEVVRSIGVLTAKGALSAREQAELNVCLSAVLKLAAKYGVEG